MCACSGARDYRFVSVGRRRWRLPCYPRHIRRRRRCRHSSALRRPQRRLGCRARAARGVGEAPPHAQLRSTAHHAMHTMPCTPCHAHVAATPQCRSLFNGGQPLPLLCLCLSLSLTCAYGRVIHRVRTLRAVASAMATSTTTGSAFLPSSTTPPMGFTWGSRSHAPSAT